MKKFYLATCIWGMLVLLAACHSVAYSGSRRGNDSEFVMEYSIFNTADAQTFKLKKGDIIDAAIVNNSGRLSIEIQKGMDEPIYTSENITDSQTFQIGIREDGEYKIRVEGKKAKGSVSFVKRE